MAVHLVGWITGFISHTGYWGVFLLMTLESACIPVPSEVVLPFAASLIVTDPNRHLNLWIVALVGVLGNLAGSSIGYWVGRLGGRRFVERYGKYILIREEDVEHADRFFGRYGQATAFFSRMLPVVRTFISLPAGIAKMPFWRFCLFTAFGAAPFCLLLAWLGVKLGQHWDEVHAWIVKANIGITVAIVAVIAWWVIRRIHTDHAGTQNKPAKPFPKQGAA